MAENAPQFTTGHDIHTLFRPNGRNIPLDALKALRNQLSLKPTEIAVSLQDPRLAVVKEWLELSSGAHDVFTVLDKQPQPPVEGVCLSILASLLTLTTQHYVYQSLGHPIVEALLTPRWLRKLNLHLASTHAEVCLAALKLLNSMSYFAGGKEQNRLLENFSWDVKIFQKLLYMRRKDRVSENDALARPDIRTLCLQLIFSFISLSSHVKIMFLEQHRDMFLSVFKGICSDPYSVVHYAFEILWTKLWQDQKVRRTLKVGLFGEKTIQHLLKLYERSAQESIDPDSIPANVVHHFLLAICTHRGIGICFADNGWYPPQENEWEVSNKKEKIYNKILANVLKTLKVNEDARQQELALKILRACPELIAGYLQSIAPTLEPRLSSKWVANAALFGAIVSLPVPDDSFHLRTATSSSSMTQSSYQPMPPPLSIVVDNIIPSTSLKSLLTRALQSPFALVQHTAGLMLTQSLHKCEMVQEALRTVELALEEDKAEGHWSRRRHEIEREVRKRVPEINVVIAFSGAQQGTTESNVKSSMLAELSQRLLSLYHRCLPSLAAEARYDVGKSLRSVLDIGEKGMQIPGEIEGLNRLQQLHVMRMLIKTDQLIWYAKAAPSAPSNLYVLLDHLLDAKHMSTRQAVSTLLTHVLRDSLLFQHDPEELQIWLNALPTGIRSSDAETPDGARLGNERQCVISFLDVCMQRCAKTPHRYIEELDALSAHSGNLEQPSGVSPVMLTVLEQLNIKMRSKTLESSDALSLTTFIRKVLVGLLGKQSDVKIIHGLAERLSSAVTGNGTFPQYPTVAAALQRECEILGNCLAWCSSALKPEAHDVDMVLSPVVADFVSQVEGLQNVVGQSVAQQAYELVDWMRLVDRPLSPAIVSRVANVIKRLHAPALSSFCHHITPGSGLLWALQDEDLVDWVPIHWILLNADQTLLARPRCISVLQAVLQKDHSTLYHYRCLAGLLIQHLGPHDDIADVVFTFEVLAILTENAKRELSEQELSALKCSVLTERQQLRRLSCAIDLPSSVVSALGRFIDSMLDISSASDRSLVAPICEYWATTIRDRLERNFWQNQLSASLFWIKFMASNDLLTLTEQALRAIRLRKQDPHGMPNSDLLSLVEALLGVLAVSDDDGLSAWLNRHLAAFLSLRECLPMTEILDRLILRSINASLPLGCCSSHNVTDGGSMRVVLKIAEVHWERRLLSVPRNVSLAPLLHGSNWSADTSQAVASFVYLSSEARRSFWSSLNTCDLTQKSTLSNLAPGIHAFFDSCFDDERVDVSEQHLEKVLFSAFAKEFCMDSVEKHVSDMYGSCLVMILEKCPSQRNGLIEELSKEISTLHSGTLHLESLRLLHRLTNICTAKSNAFAEAVLIHALQWAVRHLSDRQSSGDLSGGSLVAITNAIRLGGRITPHFAEPVIAAAISHHICHAHSMHLVEALLARVTLKPVNVNRYLQSVLQHTQFTRLGSLDPAGDERKAIAQLLFTLFHAYPANTCQPSHVEPITYLYSGSLSSADRQLLAIFHLFEEERRISVASIVMRWSWARLSIQQTGLDALLGLDATRVFRTCLSFPDRRTTAISSKYEVTKTRTGDSQLYDPVFVLLLFAQVLADSPPSSALSWVSLYRTNIVSLVIRCLSSMDLGVRKIAVLQLGALYRLMQNAGMQERPHLVHLLDLVRDSLRGPSDSIDDTIPRLPSYTSLFFAHALRGIIFPENFIYPLTARFMMQRPEMDEQDVPMLYGMLYSSGDGWKKERGWLVRFLADGMLCSDDWRLLRRRHTWDLLASLFQGSYDDKVLRNSILEVLANLTCQTRAATALVLGSSLVHWIEIQLLAVKRDESIAWVKIVENILVVTDFERVEQATRGECQKGLVRCLARLIPVSDISLLRLISRCLSRLTNGRLICSSRVVQLLGSTLVQLRAFEDTNDMYMSRDIIYSVDSGSQDDLPPHRSLGLHQPLFENDFYTWGKTVENLWLVSLKWGAQEPVCGQLCCRLLLWRVQSDEGVTPVGEWARRQTLQCLQVGGKEPVNEVNVK